MQAKSLSNVFFLSALHVNVYVICLMLPSLPFVWQVLESKLQSCRESIKDSSDNTGEKRVSITLTSTRVRHVNSTPVPTSLKDFIPLTA
ncbi:nuclear distribution protein nudE-like 1-B [Trichonephila inaurata madagascariensis]|uniref:Nuclear distribution protein nudE-like 1-B n=1 Tax=Trichonephila inaurata madagascariensis TaxID=2747483 RepID=A0A8X6I4B0_9ARAC|nr:nuclear distribution protein nudE-like 1-B [Trichonephila inaurata madagascariensis]